ncbi:UDP-N-acetyl glucosamine 2-epimerase [Streptomyces albicerus]|uniref:UDP-N-acetyl glucosamine 2-epimerase n=1 Tax=Streptomyces albicerus TaxID=2569859 RepID=UPI00124BAAC6|nr:UDP-N-acetyl glucosamine 2-epimerase [Streptomyces albicerus]
MFGLSREWLLAEDGRPVADALVLSHPEQLERLRAACPEAVHTAVLAGDPCFDRLLAAREQRERFRRALGTHPGQRLVLLNSTWHTESLFGDGGDDVLPALLPRLTSELPADEYRVAAVLHPNIWYGHRPGQIRVWLDRARRAGLTLIDPVDGWRQALLAADVVIGDHGSVTYYAAALGTPVLLGAAPLSALDPDAPISDFVRDAPRLDPTTPLRSQLDALLTEHQPLAGPAEFTTSQPGRSAALLRRHFYRQLGLPEPEEPALLEPLPLPPYEPPSRTAPLRVMTWLPGAGEVAVERYADPRSGPPGDGETHLAVHEDTRDPAQLALADVVFREGSAADPRFGPPARWTAEVLVRHPHCALAAYVTGPDSCTVRTRAGRLLCLTAESTADPAAYASALHAWLAAGKAVEELIAEGLTVRTGTAVHRVRVTPA